MAPLSDNKGILQITQIATILIEVTNKVISREVQTATIAATVEDTTPITIKEYKTKVVLPRDTTKVGDTSTNTDIPEVTPKRISNLNL